MNPFDSVNKVSSDESSGDEVDKLMKALVPTSKSSNTSTDSVGPRRRENSITTDIVNIDHIRKSVDKIKDQNGKLESLLRSYESIIDADERINMQKKIAALIQQTNSIAASSRFSLQTLKLQYNNLIRSESSTSLYNLYAQSYSAIAHSFVENISAYQKLQQRYESLLEDHYVVPQFFSDSSVEQEEQNVVLILPTTLPKEGNRICPTPIDGGLHGEPDAVSSDCMHA